MSDPPLPAAGEEAALPATVAVDGVDVPVWPEGQGTAILFGAQIAGTIFRDHAAYAAPLVEAVLAAERDDRFHNRPQVATRGNCGSKVYDVPRWGAPAAMLIHGRALMLAHRSLGRSPVFADDTWASVYRDGAFCMPHSHLRSLVSIVYVLDPGDPDAGDPYAGQLCFNDPRIEWCCPTEPGHATRPAMPAMVPGTMLLFSSAYLHSVNPYFGPRPRITLSWNITRRRLPGSPRPLLA